MTLEIQRAIRSGTTRIGMAVLVMASFMQVVQLLVIPPDWMSHPRYQAMFGMAGFEFWVSMHTVAATAMAWRLSDRVARANAARATNILMFMAWFMTYTTPAWYVGTTALASPIWVFPILAMWVFVRTIATPRDRAIA